jgi:hypothetical protein
MRFYEGLLSGIVRKFEHLAGSTPAPLLPGETEVERTTTQSQTLHTDISSAVQINSCFQN